MLIVFDFQGIYIYIMNIYTHTCNKQHRHSPCNGLDDQGKHAGGQQSPNRNLLRLTNEKE